MGFLTRLIAGLVSAATLGMGVAGTTPAVADTSTKTTGTVETTADTTTNLPDHLVNSDFEYLPDGGWKTINARYDMVSAYTSVDPVNGQYMRNAIHSDSDTGTAWVDWPGFDQSKFAWRTDQKGGHDQGGLKDRAEAVELQQDSTDGNTYAEMVASETGRTIYQDLKTIPGTLYKIRLKHASLCKDNVDQMQVVINGQPIEMTRVTSNGHGDQVGEKSTTISTKVTNENRWHHSDQWETYEGYYIIPDGQTTTRFGFKAVNYLDPTKGNLLDDVTFARAYKLTYDKNASDASGSVPANERGKENTVQPAKAETTGSVRTVADDTSGLPDHLVNGDFQTYGNEIINKRNRSALSNYLTFVDGEGNAMKDSAGGTWVKLDGWDASKFAWKSNDSVGAHSSIVELQRSKNSPTPASSGNVWAEIAAATKGKYIYQDIATTPGTMYKWSIKHASRNTGSDDSMQVMIGEPGKETAQQATRDTSNGSDSTGSVGTTITTHGTAQDGQWETYSGTYIATGTVTRFTFKSMVDSNHSGGTDTAEGNCIDDVMFTKAYKLSYDKNADDASGQVPSNTAADTTQTVASRTDGTVKSLVQRTTTHEDGSVTVRTVDSDTDVVQGCQVYYPAGQRITLATMAKDGDCWDSGMLTRPGHTQLGWNQDRDATTAQSEVTMVEGGMTVYAVWTGNPTLTYDTNKPDSWNGEMPSTPASVSVPYNTAATDGSGWTAGDTSKLRGYRFLGWYSTPQDGSNLYDWNTLLTANTTVYAHWERLRANVLYDANGGEGSHEKTAGWQYSDVTVPADTSKSFTRDGYEFLGWNTQKDGKGTDYADGSQVPLQDTDVTLYAQWRPVHTVLNPTGGVGLPLLLAGGGLLMLVGIGATVRITRRRPDDGASVE